MNSGDGNNHKDIAQRSRNRTGERNPLLVRRGGRDIKKMPRSHLVGADGVVAHTETPLVSDHPGCAASVASHLFLTGAATPPHEEGITLAPKSWQKDTPTAVTGRAKMCQLYRWARVLRTSSASGDLESNLSAWVREILARSRSPSLR